MRHMLLAALIALATVPFLSGCGVSQKQIDDAELRIKTLSEKGLPDSVLSDARIYLQQAKDGMMRHNDQFANIGRDSIIFIKKAEAIYAAESERQKTEVTALLSGLKSQAGSLSGLHKIAADSAIAVADSFVQIGWLFQAEGKAKEAQIVLDTLKQMQVRADELAPQVPGTWKCTNTYTSKEFKDVNAIENKIFTFSPDGKAMMVETKKGISAASLKEDWAFNSWGTWALRGDTILLSVSRFKIVKQDFWKRPAPGTPWKAEPGPTYDSTITDHSQDRFIVWSDLTLDFKK